MLGEPERTKLQNVSEDLGSKTLQNWEGMKEDLGSMVAPHEEMKRLMEWQSHKTTQTALRPSSTIPNLEKAMLGVSE